MKRKIVSLLVMLSVVAGSCSLVFADEADDIIPEEEGIVESETEEMSDDFSDPEEASALEDTSFEEEVSEPEDISFEEEDEAEDIEVDSEDAEDISASSVNIDETFKDSRLAEVIKADTSINTNGDDYLSAQEINAVTSLKVTNKSIYYLDGIEIFTNLTTLKFGKNNLRNADLSGLSKLVTVDLSNNKLQTLTLGNQPNLISLNVGSNQLMSLVLTGCPNLTSLDCSNNGMYTLDLSKVTNLEELTVYDMSHLTKIDITDLPYIKKAFLEGRQHSSTSYIKYTSSPYLLIVGPSLTVLCPRWVEDGSYWKYMKADGAYVISDWCQIDGKWYHFDGSGHMQTGWQKLDGKWYYFGDNGKMVKSWQKISGKWYYFGGAGAMKTGWVKAGGKWYYFDKSGVMKTGWVKDGSSWYYMEDTGAMKTGWLKYQNNWYYFGSDGKMVTTSVTINGKKYNFNSNGICKNP